MTEERYRGAALPPRWMVVSSCLTLVLAIAASVWRMLAAQSPSSPLHVGPLLGPVESLANACWSAGAIGLALSFVAASGVVREREARKARVLVGIGWAVVLAGLLVGAFAGTSGVQIIKAYPKTVAVLLAKLVGGIFLLAGFVYLAVGAVGRRDGGRGE